VDDSTPEDGIGLAVRRARRAKGLTLEQAAGLAGHHKSWLSKIENGTMPLGKRADIAALATALDVSADTLLGEPAPEVRAGRESWNLAPLREVLLDASPGDPPDIPARPVALLRDLNTQADNALRWSKYDKLLPLLPALIGELEVQAQTADGGDREEALRLLVPATATAVITLRYAAQPDLAWIAGERGRQAAALLGDPVWEAAAAYGMAHARSSTNRPRALMVMPQAVDRFEPLEYASRVEPRALASSNRRAALRMERGRAYAMQGDDAKAVREFRQAERLSPAQVVNNPLLREIVRNRLDEARRKAGGKELRGLAWRMGLI
jgi:transcriptional regulator with XRE-family HTH domain